MYPSCGGDKKNDGNSERWSRRLGAHNAPGDVTYLNKMTLFAYFYDHCSRRKNLYFDSSFL